MNDLSSETIFVANAYALVDCYRCDYSLSQREYLDLMQNLVALLHDYRDNFPHIPPTLGHFIDWVRNLSNDSASRLSVGMQKILDVLEHSFERNGDDFPSDFPGA